MDKPDGEIPVHVTYPSRGPLLIAAVASWCVWALSYLVWPRATLYVLAGAVAILTSFGLHRLIAWRLGVRFKRSESDD